jgi:hypothetical protein
MAFWEGIAYPRLKDRLPFLANGFPEDASFLGRLWIAGFAEDSDPVPQSLKESSGQR